MTNFQSFAYIMDEDIDNFPPFAFSTPSSTNADDQNVVNNVNSSNKGLIRPPKHTGERHGLRSVEEIDQKYRDVFSFQHFNTVQSKVIEDALYSDKSLVVCAPTGSGKTVIFEMAIVQLLMEMEEKNYDADFKIIYMAPIKAICTERLTEWYPKFTKFNALCIEVTGDTDIDFSQLKPYRIIITTPEKWDMLTRRWRDYRGMVEVIKLFLIDEVHILNDVTRGPVLEAVVSRMKTIQSSIQSAYRIEQLEKQKQSNINIPQIDANAPKIRFVAVSATISNPEDVSEWLGTTNKPAVFYKFGDECRPVKINRIVEGYPCPEGMNIFKFDIVLNYKLWPIIQRYNDKKPTLIFCNTRKGVVLTAETLSREITFRFNEEQKAKLTALASTIKTKKIQSLVLCGIGCHHAGLLFEERVNIERAFRNSDLPILITTTTLAMGVNLPAHLVIIKNTQQYVNGTYQEYSISTVLQMVGRAGRPQFDSEATAVIMTRLADKARYQALVGGCEPLQSYLHKRLAENLNSEVALETVTDLAQCVQWVRSTFFFVRAARNPKMYLGLSQSAPTDLISKKIEELCMKAVNGLESSGLITKDEVCCIQSTEAGRLLSIYYLDLETMKRIMKIKGDESLEQLLWVVCESHELSDMHLRVDERRCLNALNRNNTAATIRFPMKGKINTRQMKLNCIIQAVLGCLPIHDPSLNQEAIKIMRTAVRICKCLVSYVTRPNALKASPQNYQAILNAVLLAKCMESQLWDNSKYVTKQLKGIGPTYSALLATAGKINFMLLEESHPRDLERIMNKGPPAGNVLRKQISLLPKYQLTITPIDEYSVNIQLKLLNQMYLSENLDHLTAGANHKSYIIIGDSENYLLTLTSFKDKDLITIYDGEITYQTIRRHHFEHKIMAHCISSNFAGIDVHCEYLFQRQDSFLSHSKDIRPISSQEKTNGKNIKQTVLTDSFNVRKRKNYNPVETCTAEKRKNNFAIIEQIKSFTQSHDKLRNVIESGKNKKIDTFCELPQNNFDVDLVNDYQSFTNFNKKKDDEELKEILNVIDKEVMLQDKPNYNVTQKQVPVLSKPGNFSTMNVVKNIYDSEDKTSKTTYTWLNTTIEKENNLNVFDKIKKEENFTNFSENDEENDEQIDEILNKIDVEILQDKPSNNMTDKQKPVVSNPFSTLNVRKTTNYLEANTTKSISRSFNKTMEEKKNNFNVIDKVQKEPIFMNFMENNKEDDEQIKEILNNIDIEILQDKPSNNITQNQKPIVSNPLSTLNVGKSTYDIYSEVKTTKSRTRHFNKTIIKEKNNFNIIDKIQKKVDNVTEIDDVILSGEQSTFVSTVKNHIDEYLEKAKQSRNVTDKRIKMVLELSPNKSFHDKKTDEDPNIVYSDKGISATNDPKNTLFNKHIDDTLNSNKIDKTISIYENKNNIVEFKLPHIREEDHNYKDITEISHNNKSCNVINSSLNYFDLDAFKFKRLEEHDSNNTNPSRIWNTSNIDNNVSNHENGQNISKDFFAFEELQDELENDTISNPVVNVYHKELDYEKKPSKNNMNCNPLSNIENFVASSNLENIQKNTTKESVLLKLEETEINYKDVNSNNEDKLRVKFLNPDEFNNQNYLEPNKIEKTMEIDYSNDFDDSNKALVPMISSIATNNDDQDHELCPSTLELVVEKMQDKEILIDSINNGSSSLSVNENDIHLQPYFNKPVDNTDSFGCEYMKKFSFTKTQINVCRNSSTEGNYCVISKVQMDLNIIKNKSTLEKDNVTSKDEYLPNILEENKLNEDQNKTENSNIHKEGAECQKDVVESRPQREQTNKIHSNQESSSIIQPVFTESLQSSKKINEGCEEHMEQSVPGTCHTVKDIIKKYQKLASSKFCESDTGLSFDRPVSDRGFLTQNSTCNENTTSSKKEKFKRPFSIRDLDKLHESDIKNTNIQPPPKLDHSKLMEKILESIKDSTETKNEPVINELIVEPITECTQHRNFDDLESPEIQSPITDNEIPSFEQTEFLNDDLDISQSMMNPKSLLESLAQEDIILPPLQFRDDPKGYSPVFDVNLNDLDLGNNDTIKVDDDFEKYAFTSSTGSEIETWTLEDDEKWSNICKSNTAEKNTPSVSNCYLETTPTRKLKLNQFKFSRKKHLKVRK